MVNAQDILIALCDGHSPYTLGKETPYISELKRKVKENEFNKAVVNLLDIELKRCGFKTLQVAPTDVDTPLSVRVALANSKKANTYISIHYDALDGKFDGEGKDPEGHTIFVYKGQRYKESGKLADCIHKYLIQGTSQKDRGVKEADFQVLRETNMIAILSENGFMDNKKEALWMVDPKFQKEVAVEHAKGICEYFKVAYISEKVVAPIIQPEIIDTTKYRLRSGAFSNATDFTKAIQNATDKGFLVYEKADSLELNPTYRFVTGVIVGRKEADRLAEILRAFGYLIYVDLA